MKLSTIALAIALGACGGTAPAPAAPQACPAVAEPVAATPTAADQGTKETISFVVRWKFKPEYEAEAVAYTRDFIKKAKENEPDLVLYTLNKDFKEPHVYWWIERYRNQAAVDFHHSTEYRAKALPNLKIWLEVFPPDPFIVMTQVIPE
ncbi:MAG TPA: antibiotic biosynthesis monooxygenase [Kofleriaceae bacterium]